MHDVTGEATKVAERLLRFVDHKDSTLFPSRVSAPPLASESLGLMRRWLRFRGFSKVEIQKQPRNILLQLAEFDWQKHGNYPPMEGFTAWNPRDVTEAFARGWIYSAFGVRIPEKSDSRLMAAAFQNLSKKMRVRTPYTAASQIRALSASLERALASVELLGFLPVFAAPAAPAASRPKSPSYYVDTGLVQQDKPPAAPSQVFLKGLKKELLEEIYREADKNGIRIGKTMRKTLEGTIKLFVARQLKRGAMSSLKHAGKAILKLMLSSGAPTE
jgi:hypothetical protein